MEETNEIEKAKIDYNPVWRISNETFTKAASELLNIPIECVEVRRCIMSGTQFGRLTVYVYSESDEFKEYYDLRNGAIRHTNLSPNINEFKKELKTILKP